MKKFKEERGITLIALIITIVVLLILAVVAIGAVQNSGIIGHAQNAAGSFNQAKNNEVDSLIKYEEEIAKNAPGEKKEYIGNLRLNTKYLVAGKFNYGTVIFYADGKAELAGNTIDYTLNGNEVEFMGIKCEVIKGEKNDLLILGDNTKTLMAISTEYLTYFSGQKYINGEGYIILNEESSYFVNINNRSGSITSSPVLYNGIIYGITSDWDGDGTGDMITSSDNGETLVLCGEVFEKVTE